MRANTVNIVVVVDVVGILASNTLKGNIYLVDNKKNSGSIGEGTDELKTAVKDGDNIMWTILPIECEAYATITAIEFEKNVCKPKLKRFEGSDITYWIGKIKANVKDTSVNYKLKISVGTCDKVMETDNTTAIIFDKERSNYVKKV